MAYHQRKQSNSGILSAIKEMIVLILVVFLIRTFIFGLYQVPTGSMETTMLVGERFFADKFTPIFSSPKHNDIIAFNDPLFPYSSNPIIRTYQEYVGWPIWPWGPMNWTKRVIGIPGDHIKGVVEDGKPVVYRNGEKLDEPYLNKYPLLATVDPTGTMLDWRSYDPNMSFLKQPFYRVDESRLIRANQLQEWLLDRLKSTMVVTSDELMLRTPGTVIAEPGDFLRTQKGNSFWTRTDEFDIHLGENQYWLMGDNRRGSRDCRDFGPIGGRLIHSRILYRIWSIDSGESWWIVDLIKHPIDFWKRMRWNRFFQRVR